MNDLQLAMLKLFPDPSLELQNFGGIGAGGAFRFAKGVSSDFHYKNLSSGEKAAFDLLLDVFVKADEYKEAVYCIDEPEDHIATGLHGKLLEAILDLMPAESQLWVATHSIGLVRKAFALKKERGNVVFLDFSNHNFDESETIRPCVPDRKFWQATYHEALDDLADLVAPSNIVICEGKETAGITGFDADCYNQIFGDSHPDTLFVSRGGANQVERSEVLVTILQSMTPGIKVWRLIDRDEMTDPIRSQKIQEGLNVLGRRELENYLYDPEVLAAFCNREQKSDAIREIRSKFEELLCGRPLQYADLHATKGQLFNYIKEKTEIPNLGKDHREFATQFLAPALKESPSVLRELESDIFPQ